MTLAAGLALWVAAQDTGWTTRPPAPTVGDTVWIERRVTAPPGWSVRPGRIPAGGVVEPIGDPTVAREGDAWVVRYPVVAWDAGAHTLAIPMLWRLGPGGEADSSAGGHAAFSVASVLPDTGTPAPRPLRQPLRQGRHAAAYPLGAAAAAGVLLIAAVRWRQRRPRAAPPPPDVVSGHDTPDDEWVAAGEPGAVAARAAARLRAALAEAVPEAHTGLTTDECVAALGRARPDGAFDDLTALLRDLDHVAFGAPGAAGADIATLAARSRALARRVAR